MDHTQRAEALMEAARESKALTDAHRAAVLQQSVVHALLAIEIRLGELVREMQNVAVTR